MCNLIKSNISQQGKMFKNYMEVEYAVTARKKASMKHKNPDGRNYNNIIKLSELIAQQNVIYYRRKLAVSYFDTQADVKKQYYLPE